MATTTVTWTGASSGDWAVAANWKSAKPPAAGNSVVIPATSTHAPVLTASSVAIGVLRITGTTSLTIAAGATLHLTATATLSGAGGVILQGGTLSNTASGGMALTAGGGISGYGVVATKIAASKTATGAITASGGTLEMQAAISNAGGLALQIGAGIADILQLDAKVAARSLRFAGSTGTLALSKSGALTLGNALTIGANRVQLGAKTAALTAKAGISLAAGGQIAGFGTVTGAISGAGTIQASGGALVLASAVGAQSGLGLQVADSAASILTLKAACGAGNTVTFQGSHGALELAGVTVTAGGLHFAGTVAGLITATSATPDLSTIDYINSQKTVTKVVVTDSTHLALYNGRTALGTITLATPLAAGVHADWHADATLAGSVIGSGTDIFLSDVACYAAGTGIATPHGACPIERLRAGDMVLASADGRAPWTPRRIRWIGHRRIALARHPRPETVRPIRVRPGAIADGMPHRDLMLSPDHAVLVEGRLICIRQLVNGATILAAPMQGEVTYYHLELDAHAILLAEGLTAESYLDTGNRGLFAGTDAPRVLHPDLAGHADQAARIAGSCLPFLSEAAALRPIWQRLADRVAALGYQPAQMETTTEPALHLAIGPRLIRPVTAAQGRAVFVLPADPGCVQLRSRAAMACTARPWIEDRRRLGVHVAGLRLRCGTELRDIALDDPALAQGWWAVERDGAAMRRWTDGAASLALPALPAASLLEVALGAAMLYPSEAADQCSPRRGEESPERRAA